MAKYIIDIPKEYESDWVNKSSRLGFELCFPINETSTNKKYHIPTGLKLEPYTEPDRKAIEDDVWGFARGLLNYTDDDWEVITNMLLLDIPYQEAKAKYDEWRKKKEEIHVGDEVIHHGIKYVVFRKLRISNVPYMEGLNSNSQTYMFASNEVTKTGRHFKEVEKLLERMKAE